MTELGPEHHSTDPDRWAHTGPADPGSATSVRRRVRRWASALGLDDAIVDAVELATYEALANVVEHAYPNTSEPGEMTIAAVWEPPTVTVTVTDTGTWQTPTPTPDRNHGLALVDSVSDTFDIVSTDNGTVVTMEWSCAARATV